MPQWVNKTAIRHARHEVCLYDFLLSEHSRDVIREGVSLRLSDDRSVTVRRGYAGYTDFSDNSTGNAIEFLQNFLNYDFTDAVAALCEFDGMTPEEISGPERPYGPQDAIRAVQAPPPRETPQDAPERPQEPPQDPPGVFIPPEPVKGPYRQLYAYLTQIRCISPAMIQQLINWNLLYQAQDHNNMIFINPARTYAEYRGTCSFLSFHRIGFSDPDAFWWFKAHGPDSIATVAYVCEAAIDAISLYLLRLNSMPPEENGLYCSIGGVANQRRIDCIKAGMAAAGCKTVIAVDNDEAGEKCRQRNSDCPALIPRLKDWNADLIAQTKEG